MLICVFTKKLCTNYQIVDFEVFKSCLLLKGFFFGGISKNISTAGARRKNVKKAFFLINHTEAAHTDNLCCDFKENNAYYTEFND